jgi:hypothetical protein
MKMKMAIRMKVTTTEMEVRTMRMRERMVKDLRKAANVLVSTKMAKRVLSKPNVKAKRARRPFLAAKTGESLLSAISR